ncbi:hypothetical protein LCGC14_2440790, partial [marine sediment metagenome]
MQRQFDLHVHSWYSYDATVSPERVFGAAEAAGVTAVAIADHHNMDGFEAFAAAAREYPAVRWVPAMEASVGTDFGGFDVVALGVPPDAPRRLAEVVDEFRRWMRTFNRRLLVGFEALGVPFAREQAQEMLSGWRPGPAKAIQGEVRLPNVGLKAWLIERGVIAGEDAFSPLIQKAFERADGRPPLPRAEDVLPRFQAVGAALILAHPGGFLARHGPDELDALIRQTGV